MSAETKILDHQLVEQAQQILKATPGWENKQASLEWMPGGGAHKNLRAIAGDDQCMIKIWNTTWEGLGVMPPSGVVMENTRLAGEVGSGAKLLNINLDPLAMVIEFIPSTLLDTTNRNGLRRLALAAKKLHDSKTVFARDFNPFTDARTMFACAKQRGVEMPEDINSISETISRIEQLLDLRRNEFVPCHNDLYGANILESAQGEVRLVDYDLSGNGDRCYELGFFSTYSELDPDQVAHLCEDYFGENNAKLRARVELLGLAADYTSVGLWTVAKAAKDKNDDYDYEGELLRSLAKVRSKIDRKDFGDLLSLAKR